MWSHIFLVFCRVSVFVRRQKLAAKFSIEFFGDGQVNWKARRIANAFKGTTKRVVHVKCPNSSNIQIMELIFYENLFPDSVQSWAGVLWRRKNHWSCVLKGKYVKLLENISGFCCGSWNIIRLYCVIVRARPQFSKELLLVTYVSTSWAEVTFRVAWTIKQDGPVQ